MAHELAVNPETGEYMVACYNQAAWHNLGTVFTDQPETIAQGLQRVGLDAPVEILPLVANVPTPAGRVDVIVPDKNLTARIYPSGKVQPLGVVGKRYEVVQDVDAFGFLDNIVDGGASLNALGALFEGRVTFATLKIGEGILINGQDAIDTYAIVRNSHDGSTKVNYYTTPTRVVCNNTLTASMGRASAFYQVKHTAGAEGRLQDAREALGVTFAYMAEWADAMEQLAATEVNATGVEAFLNGLFPVPDEDASSRLVTMRDTAVEAVAALYYHAPTQVGIQGTAYGLYNAYVEYLDHHAPTRGKDADTRRAERVLTGSLIGEKDRALGLLLPA